MIDRSHRIPIAFVGHVDHGKSSIIGRLLAETGSLPEGKLDQVKEECEKSSKVFEYAFLLDALKDERSQGITIDSARCFFSTEKNHFLIIDAPGHSEFLKNMVTGAARADIAFLIVDAKEGIKENTLKHINILSILGLKKISIIINKMDLVDYSQKKYLEIRQELESILNEQSIGIDIVIPGSAIAGDNIATSSSRLDWYHGKTLLAYLNDLEFEKDKGAGSFRMFLQDVYRFSKENDPKRSYVGRVESGSLATGDEVLFLPSMKTSTVVSIDQKESVRAGDSIAFTLDPQIFVKRGELVCKASQESPDFSKVISVNLFWLSSKPLDKETDLTLKVGTQKVKGRLLGISKKISSHDLKNSSDFDNVTKNEIATCHLELAEKIAFDLNSSNEKTSRFILQEGLSIAGGGIISDILDKENRELQQEVINRELKFIRGSISREERSELLKQDPHFILITGDKGTKRKEVSSFLERYLLKKGKVANFLGMGSLKHGIGADISIEDGEEYIRRMAHMAHLFLEAGLITIVSAQNISKEQLKKVQTIIGSFPLSVISMGEKSEHSCLSFDKESNSEQVVAEIISFLLKNRFIS